jgi:hypothetical protein
MQPSAFGHPSSNATSRASLNVQTRAEGGVFFSTTSPHDVFRDARGVGKLPPAKWGVSVVATITKPNGSPKPHRHRHQHHEDVERTRAPGQPQPTQPHCRSTLRNIARYVRSMTTVVTMIDYQIPDKWPGGYIKWPNSPIAPQDLRLNHLSFYSPLTHFTYIITSWVCSATITSTLKLTKK